MRQFNLKGEWLVPHAPNVSEAPGRTIHSEGLRMAEGGWRGPNHAPAERVVPNESDVEADQHRAAREWLAHLEAGHFRRKEE